MPELWRTNLRSCQNQAKQLATTAVPPISVLLIEGEPALFPKDEDLPKLDWGFIGARPHGGGLYGRPHRWAENRARSVYIGGGSGRDEFVRLAEIAGRAIAVAKDIFCPGVIAEESMDARGDMHRWVYTVFDCCWRGESDGLPRAPRLIHVSFTENEKAMHWHVPVESVSAMRLPMATTAVAAMQPISFASIMALRQAERPYPLLSRIPDPFDFFTSSIANAAQASVEVIEWLLALPPGTSRNQRPAGILSIANRSLDDLDMGHFTVDADALVPALQEAEAAKPPAPKPAGNSVREPLTPNAGKVYETLLALPEHKAMTTKDILNALAERRIFIDESTFYNRIVKELEPYGLQNRPKVGYYIPLASRPK